MAVYGVLWHEKRRCVCTDVHYTKFDKAGEQERKRRGKGGPISICVWKFIEIHQSKMNGNFEISLRCGVKWSSNRVELPASRWRCCSTHTHTPVDWCFCANCSCNWTVSRLPPSPSPAAALVSDDVVDVDAPQSPPPSASPSNSANDSSHATPHFSSSSCLPPASLPLACLLLLAAVVHLAHCDGKGEGGGARRDLLALIASAAAASV